MWKRFDEQVSLSRRVSALSDRAFRVWAMLMPHTDCRGRFLADHVTIWSRCFPRGPMDQEEVKVALRELEKAGSVHVYEVRGERYLVFHDHDDYNPPGKLRNIRPKFPDPPVELCPCLGDETRRRHDMTRHDGTVSTPSARRKHGEASHSKKGQDPETSADRRARAVIERSEPKPGQEGKTDEG